MADLENPPVTPELREHARSSPNSWIYVVDPAFEGQTDVPGWAVVGGYQVDEHGEVSEEFIKNPDYRPTPRALGFAEPVNDLELALQNAATGHGGDEQVRGALLNATVFTPASGRGPGLAIVNEGLDRGVLHLFTSERYLPDTWRHWHRVPVRELADAAREAYVILNPGSTLSLRLPGTELSVELPRGASPPARDEVK